MADVNANIGINIDTSQSLAEIKNLQRQLAQLYTSINKGSAAAAAAQKGLATNLMNTINAGGKFYAQMGSIRTSTESFTHALEKNKLTMREYFRYAGGSTKTFGRLFRQEFDTIGRVAEERVKKMQTQYVKLGRDASGAMKAISITPTTLNMKEYGNQVAVAAQRQALLNQLLKQGSTNLLNFGKNTQWAGRQLMVGFTVPLAYFGTAAAKTFMDLEAQAIKFKRVYGSMFTTSGETEAALKEIQSLAEEFTKYGVAVSKTMEMAASAAAMGKTGAELTAQVAEATRLAVLGGVEQQQALETTISITNAFGIASEDLAKKIDFLNAVENQTVVSIEDLTIAVPKAGPVVKQLGGSVEDLAFFMTAMKEGGINASEGANALKSGLASLINPTDKASKMLAGMGINLKGIVEANKGNLKATVVGFAQALDKLDPLTRARAIEQLFGKFQFARLSTLFQNIVKEGSQASKVFDLMGASVEELAILSERELKTVEDAIGTNFRAAVEKLKLSIAPIGKEFLKAITPVVKFLGNLLDKFNNLSDGSKKFIVILTAVVGLLGPTLLMTFGLLMNGIANTVKLFTLMRQGFLKLTGNSTNLAQQTQYLNTEQMEAAVVAASLNQAHTKLTQQFILEAGAVNNLRNAYISATTAATRFAAANPGMMLPGFKGAPKGPIKGPRLASGTTEIVGGQAGKDSVPALLMPGEAVIPTVTAQDERFKPLVAALVSGDIAKYSEGTNEVQFGGNKYNAKRAKTAQEIRSFLNSLTRNADGSYNYEDPEGKYSRKNIPAKRIAEVLKGRADSNKFTLSEIKQKLYLNAQGVKDLTGAASVRDKKIKELRNIGGAVYNEEVEYLKNQAKKSGVVLNSETLKALNQTVAAHLNPNLTFDSETGKKIWDPRNLMSEKQFVNNYVQGLMRSTDLGSLLKLNDTDFARQLGINPKEAPEYRKSLEKIRSGWHPKSAESAKALGAYANYEFNKNKNPYAFLTSRSMDYRLQQGFYGSGKMPFLEKIRREQTKAGKYTRTTKWERAYLQKVGGKVLAFKGERIIDAAGRIIGKITGQNTEAKGINERATSRNAKDNRVYNLKPGQSLMPGIKGSGLRYLPGADEGFPKGIKGASVPYINPQQNTNSPLKVQVVQNPPPSPEEQKAIKAQQMQARMGQASMAAGGVAMVAMMSGNAELAKFAGGLSAATGILSMLPAKFMGIGAALMLAGTAVYSWTKAMNDAKKEGIELAKAMTMTSDKLIGLSKITGKISATESADLKRKNILTGKTEAQRKTGQTILQSDAGKAIMSNIAAQSKAGGTQQTVGANIGAQLVQAVLSNAMTTEQARSFAASIGEQLNDYTLSANIEGTIVNLLGPTGENLKKDPMKIALEVDKQSFKNTEKFIKYVNKEGGLLNPGKITQQNQGMQRLFSNQTSGKEKLVAGAGVAALTTAGAFIGGPLGAALGAAMGAQIADTVFDPAKSGLDKVVAAVSLGIAPAFFDLRDAQAASLKMHTAGAQLIIEEVRNNQNILDSVNKQYDIQLQSAKTEKERATIEENRRKAIKAVTEQNSQQMQQLIKMKDLVGAGAFNQAILNSVKALYKEGPMKDIAETVTNALNGLENSSYKTYLQIQLASGNIDPLTIEALMNNERLRKQFDIIAKTSSDKDASTIFQLLQKAGYAPEQIDLILNTINPDGTTAVKTITEISESLANLKQTYGININVTTGGKAAGDLKTIIESLGDKQKVSKKELEIIASTNPEFQYIYDNWNTLVGDDPKAVMTRTMILNLVGMASGDSNVVDFYLQSEGGASDRSTTEQSRRGVQNYNVGQAQSGVQQRAAVYVAKNPKAYINSLTGGTPGGDDGANNRDTTLDELLKRLKFIRKASIDAEKGVSELKRVTNGSGLTRFNGVMQQLMAGPKGGFNREFISFLEGMDNKVRATYMYIDKEGKTVLTDLGKRLKEAFNEKVIGEYQIAQYQAIQDAKAQESAFVKLKAAGVGTAQALEMVSDANLAVAINGKKISSKELRQMAQDARDAADAQQEFNLKLEASKSEENLKTLEKTARVLSKLSTMPGISKEALSRVAQSPMLMEKLYKQIFESAKNSSAEINKLLDDAAKERTANFRVQVNIDPAAAIQGQLQAVFGQAQSTIQAVISARKAAIAGGTAGPVVNGVEQPKVDYLGQIAEIKRQIAVAKGSPEVLAAQKTIREQNAKIAIQQGKLDAANSQLSQIDQAISDAQNRIQETLTNATKEYDQRIDTLNNEIGVLRNQIEVQFDYPISKLQREIEQIERKVKETFSDRIDDLNSRLADIDRQIEVQFGRPIEILQRESKGLSNELQDIEDLASVINDKYQVQQDQLQKVFDLNQKIAESQKQQIDLANALTQGDIAAAARAAQEIRAKRARDEAEAQKEMLDAQKNSELNAIRSKTGKTKQQITQRQKQIDAEIRSIEAAQERFEKEKDILGIKDQIYVLEQGRKKNLEEVEVIQKRIDAIEQAKLPLLDQIAEKQQKIAQEELAREAALIKAKSAVTALEADIARLEASKSAVRAQITAAQTAIDALKTDASLVAAEATIADLESKIDSLTANMDAITAAMDAAIAKDDTIAKLESDAAKLDAAIAAAFLTGIQQSGALESAMNNVANAAKDAATAVASLFTAADVGTAIITGSGSQGSNADILEAKGIVNANRPGVNSKTNAGSGTASAIKTIADALKDAKDPAKAVAESVKNTNESAGKLQPVLEKITQYIVTQYDKIPTIKEAFQSIAEKSKTINDDLKQVNTSVSNIKIKDFSEGVKSAAKDTSTIKTEFDKVKTAIDDAKNKITLGLAEAIKSAATNAKSIETVWSGIKTAISNAAASIDSFITKLSSALTVAQSIINTLNTSTVTTHRIQTVNEVVTTYSSAQAPTPNPTPNPNTSGYQFVNGILLYNGSPYTGTYEGQEYKDGLPVVSTPVATPITVPNTTPVITPTLQSYLDRRTGWLQDPTNLSSGGFIKPVYRPMGGIIPGFNGGRLVNFKPFGTDTVPAMLTPGEFIMSKYAVDNYGINKMKAINSGSYDDSSVYNYSINVNVESNSDADEIARTVITKIKQIDSQRIRTQRV